LRPSGDDQRERVVVITSGRVGLVVVVAVLALVVLGPALMLQNMG
jgi:hypothetical protein